MPVLRITDLMLVKVVRNNAWLTIFTKRIVPTADVCAIGSQLGCLVRLNCEFIYSVKWQSTCCRIKISVVYTAVLQNNYHVVHAWAWGQGCTSACRQLVIIILCFWTWKTSCYLSSEFSTSWLFNTLRPSVEFSSSAKVVEVNQSFSL